VEGRAGIFRPARAPGRGAPGLDDRGLDDRGLDDRRLVDCGLGVLRLGERGLGDRGLGDRGLGRRRPEQGELLLAELGQLFELLVAQELVDARRGPKVLRGATKLPVELGHGLDHRRKPIGPDRDQDQACDDQHLPETDAQHG
jgi:hypothetical protein